MVVSGAFDKGRGDSAGVVDVSDSRLTVLPLLIEGRNV
jgi:hypothetical protein